MTFWQTVRSPAMPATAPLAASFDVALAVALAVLGFVLPFSTAGVSIMLLVLAVLALIAAPAVLRSAPWRDPVIAAGLLLLAYIAVHTLVTSGFHPASFRIVNRYHELFMAPILLALFRLVTRKDAFFWGLAFGAVGYAAVHWLAFFVPSLAESLVSRRISAGFNFALCAFVILEYARRSTKPWMWRAAAAFLAVTVLFAIEGRTGQVVLLVLVACAAWLHSPRRWRLAAVICVPLAVLALALTSSGLQKRIHETMDGLQLDESGSMTSTRIRIELLRNGLYLAEKNYLAGAGFARYAEVQRQVVETRYGNDPARKQHLKGDLVPMNNPHNEYLMQIVGGGVIALALFLAWLILPMLRKAAPGSMATCLAGASLAFATGCLFNSMLMDFVEGHLYVALLVWLLAQGTTRPAAVPAGAA